MLTLSIISFLLSGVLLVLSLSLKTILLSMRVALTAAEKSVKLAGKAAKRVGTEAGVINGENSAVKNAVGSTVAVAQKTTRAVQKTGKAAVNTAKTAGKAVKTTVKVGKKLGQLSIKALKLAVRAIQGLINLIHIVISFLLSLGVVGIVILVVIILFLAAGVAGAILSVKGSGGAGGLLWGGSGTGLMVPGIASPGIMQPGITQPGITQPGVVTTPGVTVVTPGNTAQLVEACHKMADWYLGHVTTYSAPSTKLYSCDILPTENKQVGDSCAYFASAYATLVTGVYMRDGSSGNWYKDGTNICNKLLANGWKKYTATEIGGVNGLQPGDILVCSKNSDSLSEGGHCEVYIGPKQSFGWGQVQSQYPSNTAQLTNVTKTANGQSYIYISSGSTHHYGRVYRYVG